MEPILNVKSLSDRLKVKTQQDREQIEELTRSELKQLAENLRQQSAAELRTTKIDISAQTTHLALEISRQHQHMKEETKQVLRKTGETMKTQVENAVQSWTVQVQAGVQSAAKPIQTTMDQTKMAAETLQRTATALSEELTKLETSAKLTKEILIQATGIPLLVALLILCVISIASWGMLQYQYDQIKKNSEEIVIQEENLRRLPKGVDFFPESKPNRGKPLLILPKGVNMMMVCGDRPCVLLEQ